MNRFDIFLFFIVVVVTWISMMLVTFSGLFCRTTFGGVWSTIVIDDCQGSYWTPTTSLLGREEGDLEHTLRSEIRS
jgi:hypothetical protein